MTKDIIENHYADSATLASDRPDLLLAAGEATCGVEQTELERVNETADIWDKAVQNMTPELIDRCTVYTNIVSQRNDGSSERIYYGKDKELVQKYADRIWGNIDTMRRGAKSTPWQNGDDWCIRITQWGLD